MQGFLSVMMMVLFIGLVVGLVKPSLVKMKSRWRVAGVWFVGSILLSLGLPKPEHTATPVVAEAKENVVAKQPTVKEENNQKSSALYDMFNKKEEKEVAPVEKSHTVVAKNKNTNEIKGWFTGGTLRMATIKEWKEATPENRLATTADWAGSIPGVIERLKETNFDFDAMKPFVQSIESCVDVCAKHAKKEDAPIRVCAYMCVKMVESKD